MSHRRHDLFGLELGRRIAHGLREHPEWINTAKENLDRWQRMNQDVPSLLRCYREWRELLDRPLDEICAVLTSETNEAQRLRQNSPFVGILPPAEVWEIKR